MPNNALFIYISTAVRAIFSVAVSRKTMPVFSPIHHHLSPVILANATVLAFVLLPNSRFSFHCYTQLELTAYSEIGPGIGSCDLSRLLARKITKGIHSCKPTSPNGPSYHCWRNSVQAHIVRIASLILDTSVATCSQHRQRNSQG